MSDYEDLVVIGDHGLEQRTSKTGKQRYTIKVSAEPVVVNFSKEAMGGPVAMAIARHFQERIKGIAAVAAPATLKARQVAQRAFKSSAPWAMKRYSGGRIGPMEPNQTNRAFNDSGRFAESITANASKDGAWRVNVAANRLSGDAKTVQRIFDRLVQLVPEFGNPALLLQNDFVRGTIMKAQNEMLKKAKATTRQLQISGAKQLFKAFKTVDELLSA